ncbi:MAG: cytochrome P450 [Deltaproteobacteria bacterium]|nr:cytochrome P450 [Deltaproteobacteria bacterium]
MRPGELLLSDAANFADGPPDDYFRLLRREAPVCWHEERDGGGHWAIVRYEDLKTVSRNNVVFSSWRGGTTLRDIPPDHLDGSRAIMLNMDPPQHVKYRRLVQKGFTPRMIAQLAPHVRATANAILDGVARRGECDFVADIAALLPMQVICQMVGVPEEDWQPIYDLSNRLIGFDDPELQASPLDGQLASLEMFQYAAKLAEQKRRTPADDLATPLLEGEVDGEHLSELDFNSFFLLLAVAGNETTRTASSHTLRLLDAHPDQFARVRANPALIPSAIEESLRFSPPLIHFRRTASQDTELRGMKIREGDRVTMWYPSANRDEAVFADGDRFDVGRSPNDHLAFGVGEHFCLGASLARLELIILFEELLRRLPDMRLDGPVRRLRSNFVAGVKEMRVRFTPEGRGASVAVPG